MARISAPQSERAKPVVVVPRWFSRINHSNALPIGLGLTAVVGLGDFVTGVELTFTLLYTFPIAFGTWYRGKRFGVFLSVLCATCQTTTALGDGEGVSSLVRAWNLLGSLASFLLVVWIIDKLRTYVDREQREKALVASQLRHKDRLHLIGRLAAGVAHELGTQLNVVTGSAELIRAEGVTVEAQRKHTSTILGQAERMTGIIQHLLDFGRRGGTARAPTLLYDVTARAADLMRPIATKTRCRIVADTTSKQIRALVNAHEIEQVLTNIILNGIQSMPGGGTVRLSTHVATSSFRGTPGERFSCISIEDEGSGIDPADLPHIFDPFFTTKGIGEGTGLGLSVSYGIVSDHGGMIDVSSALGKGTRFSMLLPLEEDETA